MARNKKWENLPSKNTPLRAADLQYYEDSINGAEERLDNIEKSGGGHKILDQNGIELSQEPLMQFKGKGIKSVSNINGVTVVDVDGAEGPPGKEGLPGQDGNSVISTSRDYQVSTSGTDTPTGTWSTTIPTVPKGQYLWQRDIDTFSDSTTSQPRYTVTYQGLDGSGTGDMLKSTYDKNDNGKVDVAENSEKLNGKTESELSVANAENSTTVNGKTVARNVLSDEYTNAQIDAAIDNAVENQAIINESLSTAIETKLSKPKIRTVNLPLSAWVGEQYPIITLTGITEIKSNKTLGKITYVNQGATTDENYLVYKNMVENADLQPTNELQDVGKLVLKCWGEKPTTDLPILLLIGGESE